MAKAGTELANALRYYAFDKAIAPGCRQASLPLIRLGGCALAGCEMSAKSNRKTRMKIDVYEETYSGLTWICRRLLRRGHIIKYNNRWWHVRREGNYWMLTIPM
jgi:hypothetical protein